MMETMESSDASLVAASLAGNREAFGQIVARYQTLICSFAYSRMGSLTKSEDVAQETFVAAWKHLANLREPEKLRPWLCGIARNHVYDALKKDGRQPVHRAESLEQIAESPSPEPLPLENTISNEEAAILWRSLEKIPEIYREPLILFYREHQSIEKVAQSMELTEDAVKQRLSRGRKLLHEQVLAFVEGALGRTGPGKVFTLSVLGALPVLTISAKAATVGAAAAKGSATAKAAAATGLVGSILGPVLGFAGLWLGYRMSMDAAESEREREFTRSMYKRLIGSMTVFFVAFFVLVCAGGSMVKTHVALFVSLLIGMVLAYVLALTGFSIWCYRARRSLLAKMTPAELATKPMKPVWEYRSEFKLLGLPLIHVRIGDRMGEPIKAWIAVGDCAFGLLFAFGGLAIAPVSIGGCAVGLFAFGGLGVAALAVGGMALGVWSFGGLAIGIQAFGGCAIAQNAAWGGFAVARDYALGGSAHALQVNNDVANQFIHAKIFFRISEKIMPYLMWFNLIWIIPLSIQWRVIKRKRRATLARAEN